jgi:hypothetical protein
MPDAHDTTYLGTSTLAEDDIAHGITVWALVTFWCLICIAVHFMKRRRRKHAAEDTAFHAETAVVL